MFKSRQDVLEEAFMKHMDKEEESFKKLITTLDLIKDELHKTNSHIVELDASQTLRLTETRSQILEIVFEKLVSKREYSDKVEDIESSLDSVIDKLDGKVSKNEVRMVWGVLLATLGVLKYFN